MIDDLVAVVPAGGAGTRLWPMSRESRPKFLLDLTGSGRSLLQQTCDRLGALTSRTLVVTGAAHAASVARQLPTLNEADLLVEPLARESAAAIGLAAAVSCARDRDAVIGSFAADHVIDDQHAFRSAVAQAVAVARTGLLVTIGITATRPATGFGYVRAAGGLDVPGAPSALQVAEFVEKPDAETARGYVDSGQYRWNAGMFVVRAAVLLELLDTYRPDLGAGLREIGAAWDGPHRQELLERVWPGLERVAIDYAVAEPAAAAGRVAVVPGEFGWDDVGDFASLAAVLPPAAAGAGAAGGVQAAGVQVLGDAQVLVVDSSGVVVASSGRTIALVGLQDVVVVDTPDAVLVTVRERAQDVKAVVDELRAEGRTDLL